MSETSVRQLWTDPRRRRWVAFAALVSVYGLVSVYRLSTAVLADDLSAAFDVTGAQLGTLHASFFYIYALLQLPAGVLADRLGSRKTVAVGGVVMSVGGLGFAAADSYLTAFLGRALIGLGGGLLFVAILRFCANWFRPDEFGRMNGITIAVAGLGGILATTPLALAVGALGWRETIAAISVAGLGLALAGFVLARDSPAAAGLEPIGGAETQPASSLRTVLGNARQILGELETWLVSGILFVGTGINITVIGLWGVPYLVQTFGVSVTYASTFTLLGSVGLLVGPPTIGALSDRIGDRIGLIVAGSFVYTLAFASLAVTSQPPVALVAVVFFVTGVVAGAYVLSYPVMKERHDATAAGVATGTANMMAFLGAAVMPTAMGVILDLYWTGETIGGARVYTPFGYQLAFGLATAAGLVSFVLAVWLYRRER